MPMSRYQPEEIVRLLRCGGRDLPDLRGADLSRVDLSRTLLAGLNFSRVNLRGANLRGALLDQANFFKANLEGADLRGARLRAAALKEAKLWGANLGVAEMVGANLVGAGLDGANLVGANLDGADLAGADLKGADLRAVSLRGGLLKRADLWGANLWEADLRGADLRESRLCAAILTRADLKGADITGANIWGLVRDGWKIEGINAEYVYDCAAPWIKGEKERSRRDFEPAEFERLHKARPCIEMIFAGGISPLDYVKMVGVGELIGREHPEMQLKIESLRENAGRAILRLSLSRDAFLEQALGLLAHCCRRGEFDRDFLFLMKDKYDIYLEAGAERYIFPPELVEKIRVRSIKQSGLVCWEGKLGQVEPGDWQLAGASRKERSPGKLISYNLRPDPADALLVEGEEARQDLGEVLVNVLRAKRRKKSSEAWS